MGTKRKPEIWQTDYGFIGSTGTNSVHEFAELIVDNSTEGYDEMILDIVPEVARDVLVLMVATALEGLGVQAVKVPAALFHNESWSDTYPIPFDAKPGRGYTKVIGVLV